MEKRSFFQTLRRRDTEKGNNQNTKKSEPPEPLEVKRTTWPSQFTETGTPGSPEFILHPPSNGKQRHWSEPSPAIFSRPPPFRPRPLGQLSTSRASIKNHFKPGHPVDQGSLLKPTVFSPNNGLSGSRQLAEQSRNIQHRAGSKFHTNNAPQLVETSRHPALDVDSYPQQYEYPELVPKPLALPKNRVSQAGGDEGTERAKSGDEDLRQDSDAGRLEHWREFYSQKVQVESMNEIDEYLSDMMFKRLLEEAEVEVTDQPPGYRSEIVVQEYWDNIRAWLNTDEEAGE